MVMSSIFGVEVLVIELRGFWSPVVTIKYVGYHVGVKEGQKHVVRVTVSVTCYG